MLSKRVRFFAASFLPALLTLREMLIYHAFGLTLSQTVRILNDALLLSKNIVNSNWILSWGGIWSVPVIVFVETGLFFGFFLPGDSLLIASGVLGAIGYVNLGLLIPLSILAAIGGDQLNYAIGHESQEALANRFQFVRNNLLRASEFYSKHGARVIVLARFVPVIRTFAPAAAGVARMNYSKFTLYNVCGGILWVTTLSVTGYFIGVIIPNFAKYSYPVILTIIAISWMPSMLIWFRQRKLDKATVKSVTYSERRDHMH
jgi:membrane-associated protein